MLQLSTKFLPARRYAGAGLCDSNVSVRHEMGEQWGLVPCRGVSLRHGTNFSDPKWLCKVSSNSVQNCDRNL